jgi:hypothetical protein
MANAAKHKDALVCTAMRLFRRQGYASTGLQQILSESGAPKGSLYHYFPGGKEGLACEKSFRCDWLVGGRFRHFDTTSFRWVAGCSGRGFAPQLNGCDWSPQSK